MQLKKKKGMLERQEAFYENIQIQSKCYSHELNYLERSMDVWHRRKKEADSEINEHSDEVSELIGYINLTDKEMRNVKNKLKEITGSTDEWKDKLIDLKEELEALKAKYDVVTMESLTSAEHTKQLQEFLDKEEKKGDALAKELAKQIVWKSQREKQNKDISQELTLAESTGKNLKAAILRARKQWTSTSDYVSSGCAFKNFDIR